MIENVDPPREAGSTAAPDSLLLPAILDAVADGVSVQDPAGRLVYANETALRMIGFDTFEELAEAAPGEIVGRFDLLDERGLPLDPSALPGRIAFRGTAAGPIVVGYRIRTTSETRWSEVRATPLIDPDGRVTHAINTFHDITDRIRIESDLRASEESYRQLVEAMPQVAWTTDAEGRLLMVNARWREYTGQLDTSSTTIEAEERVHADDRPELDRRWAASLATGERLEMAARLRRHDGVYRWHLVRTVPIRREDGEIAGWIGTSTDIEDERRAQDGARLLAAAAAALDESLDPAATANAAAAIAVRSLADLCVIELLDANGVLRVGAVATPGDDPAVTAIPARSRRTDRSPVRRAIEEGRPIVDEIDDGLVALLPGAHRGDERVRRIRSSLAVPLVARDRTLGAIYLASRTPGRYAGADGPLAEELARRVALALSNSELYAAEQVARETAEATAAKIAALQQMTRALSDAPNRDEIAAIATRHGAAAVGASSAALYVPDGADPSRLALAATFAVEASATAPASTLTSDGPSPLAQAYREREVVWLPDAQAVDDARLGAGPTDGDASAFAAVPLAVADRVVGVLGLGFASRRAFELADRELVLAQASVVSQAIDRVGLAEARERLLEDLEFQRNRLETILRRMPAGVLIADADGRLVLSNAEAGEIWRAPIPTDRHVDEYVEYVARYPDGRPLATEDWPLTRALRLGETISDEELEIVRFDGTTGWISVGAAPIRDRDGGIVAAVSTFSDVTAQHLATDRQRFLSEASAVLASSLDYEETLARVMRLAVPGLADWAVVDLVGSSGALDRLVVAHVDPDRVALARELRERFPPDPAAPMGPYAVARSGKAELVPDIPRDVLAAIGDPEYRRIIEELQFRSYMAVPLIAGGETLGVLTFVAAESGRRYTEEDLSLAEALAARSAAAIQNARLFRDVARFKATLDATLDAIFMFEPESLRIRYVNRGAVDQLGWSHDELGEMAVRDLSPELDEARLRALLKPLVEGGMSSRTVSLTLRGRHGSRVPVEVLLQYVEPPGEPGRILAIARDISDRVEAQARLQRLAEAEHVRAAELNAVIRAMGEGVVVCEADGGIVLANPAAEEIFPGIAGGTYRNLLERLDNADGHAPPLGQRGGPVDLRVIGDPERWVELSTYPVTSRDSGMAPDGEHEPETIVLLREVTAARQRQAVRDTFIGVLSHELRTPITTIYAGSKVLARGRGLDEEIRRSIFDDIHVEAERLHRLVEDVIALRRFGEEDEGEVGREPVLLQRVLPGVLRSEETRWPGVTFDFNVPSGVPTVVADPTYVEQVVRNLLSNAAKYGGPSSRVTARVESGDGEVIVRILDDGPGFPAQEADRLFELFFRSPSTAGAASGAGIGLFVSARLIRAMGGRIWARPRPEGGAEFGFALQTMDELD